LSFLCRIRKDLKVLNEDQEVGLERRLKSLTRGKRPLIVVSRMMRIFIGPYEGIKAESRTSTYENQNILRATIYITYKITSLIQFK